MKIINFGQQYEIYPDNLKTYDQLPAQTYRVAFHPMSGFSLVKTDALQHTESKIYGDHQRKIDKVMRTYNRSERSLGMIMSGDKGIGKTMSLQLLADAAHKENMPVILININDKGLVEFIDSIKQNVLIVFDEFEKTFDQSRSQSNSNSELTTQNDLLGLFDGMSPTKRLYAVTANQIRSLNDYLINRPGRFHYHFRYDYPSFDDVVEYLNDKVDENITNRDHEIQNAATFSLKVPLNYDMLRAIATELSFGESFKNAIQDLNIMNMQSSRYELYIELKDGTKITVEMSTDLFKPELMLSIDAYNHNNSHDLNGHIIADGKLITVEHGRFNVPVNAITAIDVTLHADDERHIQIKDIESVSFKTVNENTELKYLI